MCVEESGGEQSNAPNTSGGEGSRAGGHNPGVNKPPDGSGLLCFSALAGCRAPDVSGLSKKF